MRKSYCLLWICFLSSILPAFAQGAGSISDVRFIQGSWKANWGDRTVDAVWSSTAGENIVGYVRVIKDNKVVLYELFAFEQTAEGLVALVRHFGPGLVAREEKDTPNLYRFLEAGNGWAVFKREGEETRVKYERRSDDEFAIVIGKPESGEWAFKDFWVFKRTK